MLLTVWMLFGINQYMQKSTWIYCCSVVWLLLTPWIAACWASVSFTISQSLLKLMSTESMMASNHLILCHPPLLLPSIFPSIRVFSNGLALPIRCPKYCVKSSKKDTHTPSIFYHWCDSHSLNIYWMLILHLELFRYCRHKNEKQYSSSLHWV